MATLINYKGVDVCQQEHTILREVELQIQSGEFIYLLGKVGSGKSSLLKSFYAEIPIKVGEAEIFNYDLLKIKQKQIPFLRRKIGIVFQDFQLLIDRTVEENLLFVLKATGWRDKGLMSEQIKHVLSQVGMEAKGYKMPHQLSGGEQQRVVVARALLNSPEIILADEPTGNLDPETAFELMELLYAIRRSGTTILIATHNLKWTEDFPGRKLRFADGTVVEEL